jgi:phosphohistidine phosphatase
VAGLDLFILRHGDAGRKIAAGSTDAKRALTVAGQKEIADISKSLKDLGIKINLVITSPLKRAQETATIVAKTLKVQSKMQEWNELTPEANRIKLYGKLSSYKQDASILIVGHNPYLSEMISEIISEDKNGHIDLKKGGVARIRITSSNPAFKGELKWLITPRLLKRLSKST